LRQQTCPSLLQDIFGNSALEGCTVSSALSARPYLSRPPVIFRFKHGEDIMSYEQHLTLNLVARFAGRFGPSSKIAREVPGWLEYLTEIECPERPRTRPGAVWWNKIRDLALNSVPDAAGGEGETVLINATRLGRHFGLSEKEVRILSFVTFYKLFDAFEHVVDGAVDTKEATLPLLLSQFCETDEASIRMDLRADGRLRTSGLLHWDRHGRGSRVPYDVSNRLCRAMLADVDGIDGLISLCFRLRRSRPQNGRTSWAWGGMPI